MLDDITLYWLTNTGASSARLYWENNNTDRNSVNRTTPRRSRSPSRITAFPGEIYPAPRSWAERAYPNLIYFNKVDKGGHFAAWEEPDLLRRTPRAIQITCGAR